MTVQTYDPKDVAVTVDGQLLSGFGEEMISAERDNPQVDDLSGAQGDVARAMTNDKRGAVTVTLLQTSPANLILSDLWNADGVDGANKVFPFLVKDNRGLDVVSAEDAWISEGPTVIYNKGIEERAWIIRAGKLDMVIGGVPDVA